MVVKKILEVILKPFKFVISKVSDLIKEINRIVVIKTTERDITRKLNKFKVEFDEFMNEYYDYLPLPQGKSIIQNTLKSGKIFYLVIFNDIRKKYAFVSEIFSDPYFPLPSQYNLLQRIDITEFMNKIKENMETKLSAKKRRIFLN